MVTRWMAAGAPMKGSELMAAMPSPREKATARHGSWNLKLNRSLPVSRSHSFADESPDPVSSLLESPAEVQQQMGPGQGCNRAFSRTTWHGVFRAQHHDPAQLKTV